MTACSMLTNKHCRPESSRQATATQPGGAGLGCWDAPSNALVESAVQRRMGVLLCNKVIGSVVCWQHTHCRRVWPAAVALWQCAVPGTHLVDKCGVASHRWQSLQCSNKTLQVSTVDSPWNQKISTAELQCCQLPQGRQLPQASSAHELVHH